MIGDGTISITSGSGSPEGAVTAPAGSIFSRTDGGDGSTVYIKQSGTGSAGWSALGGNAAIAVLKNDGTLISGVERMRIPQP